MIEPLVKRWNRWRYLQASRAVLGTPPIPAGGGDVVIFSMLTGRHILMYLFAAKSLYAHLRSGRFVVLDDGSMSEEDREVLRRHLKGVRILHIDQVERGPVPRGGCWERLLTLCDLAQDSYVVQLDADTLTVGGVEEVARHVAANRSFTLVSEGDADIRPIEAAVAVAKKASAEHIQVLAEQSFERLPNAAGKRYVRGCAGFAGYARGSFSREQVNEFSVAMGELLGPRWSEWGTEQVASNYLVANAPGSVILPIRKYRNYEGQGTDRDAAFLHFIGSHRFADATYRTRSLDLIAALA